MLKFPAIAAAGGKLVALGRAETMMSDDTSSGDDGDNEALGGAKALSAMRQAFKKNDTSGKRRFFSLVNTTLPIYHVEDGEETDSAGATSTASESSDDEDTKWEGDYVTRCICGLQHNDEFMISCDSCELVLLSLVLSS